MFEASVKAVTAAYPKNDGAQIALLGGKEDGRQDEWLAWNQHVDPQKVMRLPDSSQCLNQRQMLRGNTLAGVVIFDKDWDNEDVRKMLENSLLTAALLIHCAASKLIHKEY